MFPVKEMSRIGPEEAPGCGADIPIEDLPIAPGEVLLLSLSLDELKAQVKLQPEVFKKATTPAPGSVLPLIIMESTKENLQAVGINMTKAQIKEDEQKNPDAYMYGPPIAIELAEAAKTLTFQLDIYQTVDAAPEPTPAVPGGGPVPAEATPAVMPADSPYSTGDPKLDDLYAQSDKIMDQINKYQDERQGKMDNQALEVIKQAQGGGGAPTPGGAPVPGDKKPGENGTPAPEDGKPKEGDQAKPSSSTAPVPAPSAPPAMAGQPPAPPAMKAREVKENLLGRDGPHVHHATPKLRVREAQPKSAVRARGLNDKLLGRSGYGHVHHASGRKA
ncbi:hypothetical protein M7I_4040 [Glarea lozoyensis 74030]|uniref:Uncharacterized protein n=1 Tax=Glarea lozoyensis (strain ATCC 74030 / MF5533) TaxID=1104152 RepID=H0EN37_GLAL7|nr:hypothetical protein M7I_4040 [Glarea lozoyensis 74030]